jgi:hypothetical protein
METQADDTVRGSSSFHTPPIPVVPYSHPRDPDAIGSPASAPARSPRKAIEEGGDVPIPNPDGGGTVVALPRFFGVIPTWPPRIQGSAPTMARHGSLWPHHYSMRARLGMSPTVAGNDGDDGCAAVVDEELGTARWSLSAEASPGVRLIFAPIRSVPSTRSCP